MIPLLSTEKEKVKKLLNENYGITDVPYLLLKFGKEKLRAYSGSLSKEELMALDRTLKIETAGLYFANESDGDLRLTLDGTQLFKEQILKNILNVDDKQAENWLKGNELYIETSPGFKVIKHNFEFIGCGKSTGKKISNFVPKERRVKD